MSHDPTASDRLRQEGHPDGPARKFKQVESVACYVPWFAYRDHHSGGVGVDFPFFPLSRLVGLFAPSNVMPEHLGMTEGQGNQSVIKSGPQHDGLR